MKIPTSWSAVASHDTSDMSVTSCVTELLARAKGKRKLPISSPSPLVSTLLHGTAEKKRPSLAIGKYRDIKMHSTVVRRHCYDNAS